MRTPSDLASPAPGSAGGWASICRAQASRKLFSGGSNRTPTIRAGAHRQARCVSSRLGLQEDESLVIFCDSQALWVSRQ